MAHRQQRPAPNAIFHGEQGATINIHDGNFTQYNHAQSEHNCFDADDGFKHLQAHVATAAFDSAQRVDAPKCHPNTRQAIQDDIMDWILQTVTRIQWMMWLNGAAGAGKSAIARSIVALCLARNIPVARFFFFRTDATRNTLQPVVATLVHQLIQQLPDLVPIIIPKIQSDPLIFTKSLETQLQYLIFEPLRQLHRECPLRHVVLLFDGVDECAGNENQVELIHLISNCLRPRDLPVLVFFGSRAENQLQQVFRTYDISASLLHLTLDDHYLPDADIHLFLVDKFKLIKETHPFARHLDEDWPKTEHVQQIVQKSSGQFIYASVVITFISSPRQHPAQQLEIVCGLRPPGNLTPFAELDALYRHIFSQVQDIDHTSLILAWNIFSLDDNRPNPKIFSGISSDDLCVLLADLTSIIAYEHDHIHFLRFLHASFPDFLRDRTRSHDYYLDRRLWCTRLSIHCFCQLSKGIDGVFYQLNGAFLPYAEGTAELREHVLAFDLEQLYDDNHMLAINYLSVVQKVDFGDGGEFSQSQINRLTRHIMNHPHEYYRDYISALKIRHDISAVLTQIESEKAGDVALQQTDETGSNSAVLDAPHISRDISKHHVAAAGPMADASTVNQHPKARGKKRATGRVIGVEATPRRSGRLESKNNTPTSSNQPATATAKTRQERGRAKKKASLSAKF